MTAFFEFLERLFTSTISWAVDRLPMPRQFRQVLHARRNVLQELAKFFLAGLSATLAYIVVLIPANSLLPTSWLAVMVANIPAIAASYLISSRFVFVNYSGHARHTEIIMFFAMNAIAVAFATPAVGLAETINGSKLSTLMTILVSGGAVLLSWGFRFFVARRFIFKSHLERPPVDVTTELAHISEELEEGIETPRPSQNEARTAQA